MRKKLILAYRGPLSQKDNCWSFVSRGIAAWDVAVDNDDSRGIVVVVEVVVVFNI
jgi:hypothetical protein